MAATCPKSQYFPRNRRLTVGEQMDLDDHARKMWIYMNNKIEDDKLTALRKEVRAEEKKFFRAMRKQKKALKKAVRATSRDSGYSSGSTSRPESQVPSGLVPNPFYQGPPTASSSGVVSPSGGLTAPAISQRIQLVCNPFYDPDYVAKHSK